MHCHDIWLESFGSALTLSNPCQCHQQCTWVQTLKSPIIFNRTGYVIISGTHGLTWPWMTPTPTPLFNSTHLLTLPFSPTLDHCFWISLLSSCAQTLYKQKLGLDQPLWNQHRQHTASSHKAGQERRIPFCFANWQLAPPGAHFIWV